MLVVVALLGGRSVARVIQAPADKNDSNVRKLGRDRYDSNGSDAATDRTM